MATAHISANKGDIAKRMVMVGDPLRAKMVAENFLENPKLINEVRGMLGYTGTYKGTEVTVMGHGMGISSVGIYAYELFDQYGVEVIIRAGSAGSFKSDVNLRDVVIGEIAYTDSSNFGLAYGEKRNFNESSKEVIDQLKKAKDELKLKSKIIEGNILSSQWFYKSHSIPEMNTLVQDNNILAVEMEAYALNAIAKTLGKKTATILTISDHVLKREELPALERQESFKDMMSIALTAVIKL